MFGWRIEMQKNGPVVFACELRFCVHFGREAKAGSKRKLATNINYFATPFRAGNYKQHHKKQRAERWNQYQATADEEKKRFYDGTLPLKGTLNGYFGPQ